MAAKKLTLKAVIAKFRAKHGRRYDYSEVIYIDIKTPVTIICRESGHGRFPQIPHNHINGTGCPTCAGTVKLTHEEYVAKSEAIHGKGTFTYPDRYVASNVSIRIFCTKLDHGIF